MPRNLEESAKNQSQREKHKPSELPGRLLSGLEDTKLDTEMEIREVEIQSISHGDILLWFIKDPEIAVSVDIINDSLVKVTSRGMHNVIYQRDFRKTAIVTILTAT